MSSLGQELEELGGDITTALEDVQVSSFLVDPDASVRWQNKAAEKDAGSSLVGRGISELVVPEQQEEVQRFLERLLCSGEPAELTVDITADDGTVLRREISAAPVRDGNTVVAVFGVAKRARTYEHVPADERGGLTDRQLEVLQLLADGKSTEEIADELVISKVTVRNHIAHIMAALGVHTRVQALVAASRNGLIRLEKPQGEG